MINAVHVLDELKNLVGIADLVVVPGNDLHEGVGQSDAGLGVEDGGAGVAEEVGRNDGLVGVTQNALQLALGGFLHGVADLFVGSGLREVDSQVNDGDIQRRNTHGHTGQLAVQLGDDLADSLGSAGGRRDDVAGSSAAASPVLHGRAVNGLLGSGGGVYGGHQTVFDTENVIQNLGNRGQAVRSAGSVGNKLSSVFFGLFGLVSYIFPIGLVLLTAFGLSNKGNKVAWLKVGASILFLMLLCLPCLLPAPLNRQAFCHKVY